MSLNEQYKYHNILHLCGGFIIVWVCYPQYLNWVLWVCHPQYLNSGTFDMPFTVPEFWYFWHVIHSTWMHWDHFQVSLIMLLFEIPGFSFMKTAASFISLKNIEKGLNLCWNVFTKPVSNEEIILKYYIFKIWDEEAWTGLLWPKLVTDVSCLCVQ
jgi:hypothetical protein